jgi:AraC-binding-like domain
MVSWSTDSINERERFSYWREIVCNTIFSISPEAPRERFSASLQVRSCGPLRFAMCPSTSYEIIRTRRDIDRAPADHYTVYLQLHGQTVINQCGESVAISRNDIVLSDCRRPYRGFAFPRRISCGRGATTHDGQLSRALVKSSTCSQARDRFTICRSRAAPHGAPDVR